MINLNLKYFKSLWGQEKVGVNLKFGARQDCANVLRRSRGNYLNLLV